MTLQKNLTMYRRLGVYTWLSQRSLWIFAVLWSLVLGAVCFGLAYFVARGIAQPIVALRAGMSLASQGDLTHRVKPSGTSEVRYLAASFNRMVEELQASRRALLRAERLAAWREVARAVAHEIRNPLTPIQFALQRLRTKRGGPRRRARRWWPRTPRRSSARCIRSRNSRPRSPRWRSSPSRAFRHATWPRSRGRGPALLGILSSGIPR